MAQEDTVPHLNLALMNEPGSRQSVRLGRTLVPVMLIGSLVMVATMASLHLGSLERDKAGSRFQDSLMGERGTADRDHTSRQDAFPRRRDH